MNDDQLSAVLAPIEHEYSQAPYSVVREYQRKNAEQLAADNQRGEQEIEALKRWRQNRSA